MEIQHNHPIIYELVPKIIPKICSNLDPISLLATSLISKTWKKASTEALQVKLDKLSVVRAFVEHPLTKIARVYINLFEIDEEILIKESKERYIALLLEEDKFSLAYELSYKHNELDESTIHYYGFKNFLKKPSYNSFIFMGAFFDSLRHDWELGQKILDCFKKITDFLQPHLISQLNIRHAQKLKNLLNQISFLILNEDQINAIYKLHKYLAEHHNIPLELRPGFIRLLAQSPNSENFADFLYKLPYYNTFIDDLKLSNLFGENPNPAFNLVWIVGQNEQDFGHVENYTHGVSLHPQFATSANVYQIFKTEQQKSNIEIIALYLQNCCKDRNLRRDWISQLLNLLCQESCRRQDKDMSLQALDWLYEVMDTRDWSDLVKKLLFWEDIGLTLLNLCTTFVTPQSMVNALHCLKQFKSVEKNVEIAYKKMLVCLKIHADKLLTAAYYFPKGIQEFQEILQDLVDVILKKYKKSETFNSENFDHISQARRIYDILKIIDCNNPDNLKYLYKMDELVEIEEKKIQANAMSANVASYKEEEDFFLYSEDQYEDYGQFSSSGEYDLTDNEDESHTDSEASLNSDD